MALRKKWSKWSYFVKWNVQNNSNNCLLYLLYHLSYFLLMMWFLHHATHHSVYSQMTFFFFSFLTKLTAEQKIAPWLIRMKLFLITMQCNTITSSIGSTWRCFVHLVRWRVIETLILGPALITNTFFCCCFINCVV